MYGPLKEVELVEAGGVVVVLLQVRHIDTSFNQVQGDPCGRGILFVDIYLKIPSQAWVTGQSFD